MKSSLEAEAYNETIQLLGFGFDNFENSSIPTNSSFFVGEVECITPREIAYTHQAGEKVAIEVKEDSKLRITDQEGTLLSSYQFPIIGDAAQNRSSIQQDSRSFLKQGFSNAFYLLVIGGSMLSFLFYRVRKKQ